jgi:hypothetical protein
LKNTNKRGENYGKKPSFWLNQNSHSPRFQCESPPFQPEKPGAEPGFSQNFYATNVGKFPGFSSRLLLVAGRYFATMQTGKRGDNASVFTRFVNF